MTVATAHRAPIHFESDAIEDLLIELSSLFIRLPAAKVDSEIEVAQARLCDYLDLDRSALWQQVGAGPFYLTHLYQRTTIQQPPPNPDARRMLPWVVEQLTLGNTVVIPNVTDLPPEAARDRESFQQIGMSAVVVVPVPTGEDMRAALTFASAVERDHWSEGLVRRFRLVAELFGNALARANGERILREKEDWLRAVIDKAADGIITVSEAGVVESINPAALEIFGYEARDLIGQNVDQLMAEGNRSEGDSFLSNFTTHGTPVAGVCRELVGQRKDGSKLPVDAAISEAKQQNGRRTFTCILRDTSQRKQAEYQLHQALDEVRELREQLRERNVDVQEDVKLLHGRHRIVGKSRPLQQVLAQVEQVAPTGSTVLIIGETGTGKELIAGAIHGQSPRSARAMVRVNCSAIPASLIESELFGREKGAYTGALSKQIGRFEMANGSTLFLDEIGDLPLDVQVKLLRVLQEKQIERLGSSKTISVDVRIVTATNHDLERAVREGRFREDLYYRLNVFPILVPPLRDRLDDIPALVSAIVGELGATFGKKFEAIDKESLQSLQLYAWPGNVRELRNVIERAMIVAKGPVLRIDWPVSAAVRPQQGLNIKDIDREHILKVLKMTSWRIRGRGGAAEILGLKPTTLESRMAKLGLLRATHGHTK